MKSRWLLLLVILGACYACASSLDWGSVKTIRMYSRSDWGVREFQKVSKSVLRKSAHTLCDVNVLQLLDEYPQRSKSGYWMRKGSSELLLIEFSTGKSVKLEILAGGIIHDLGSGHYYEFSSAEDRKIFDGWLNSCRGPEDRDPQFKLSK